MAWSLTLSLPGTPVMFMGDEIGMGEQLEIPDRYAVRVPMQWSREPSGVYPFYGREHARAEAGGRRLAGRADYPESTAAGAAMWKPMREVWQELSTEFAQERDRLQQAALLAGRSILQDLVRIAGQSLIDQLSRPAGSGTSGRANPSRLRVTGGNTP